MTTGSIPQKKVIFPFIHIDRIGEVIDQMFCLRNLFPVQEYEIFIITYDPSIRRSDNEATFNIATRGMHVNYSKDVNLVGSSYKNPAANRIIRTEDSIHVMLMHTQLKAYHREVLFGKKPCSFFKLSVEEENVGVSLREKLNVPREAKMVCLYVRDGACFGLGDQSTYRNANIQNYLPTVKYLVEQGYHVIRIGDRNMQPLEVNDARIIDTPFHPAYTSLVEPYFISKCDFVIGTSSGPMGLAPAFNKPVIYVDSIIDSGYQIWINPHTILLFKKYSSAALGRNLTYEEIIMSPAVDYYRRRLFEDSAITLIDNSPEEILSATKEMIARIGNNWPDSSFTQDTDRTIMQLHAKADYFRQKFVGPDTIPFFPFYSLHRHKAHVSHEYVRLNPWFLGHKWPVVTKWGWEPHLEVNR